MRSYAAGRWGILWKLRVPNSLPYLFSAFRIAAPLVDRRRDHLRARRVDPGRPRRRDRQLQPVLLDRAAELWATNVIAALLGIAFFLAVVLAEKLVVRRAPEHVA